MQEIERSGHLFVLENHDGQQGMRKGVGLVLSRRSVDAWDAAKPNIVHTRRGNMGKYIYVRIHIVNIFSVSPNSYYEHILVEIKCSEHILVGFGRNINVRLVGFW